MTERNPRASHSYPLSARLGKAIMIAVALLGVASFAASTYDIATRVTTLSDSCWYSTTILVVNLVGLLVLTSAVLNWDPEIQVTEEGLLVQVFIVKRMLIPWRDVVGLRPTVLSGLRMQLLVVRKLTLIHRILGLSFGLTWHPCIPIRGNIGGYDDLTSQINLHLSREAGQA